MKTLILFSILLLTTSISVFGQNKKKPVVQKQIVVGKSNKDGTEIIGSEYTFPNKIHRTYLDTTTGYIMVQLRGIGKKGKWLNNRGEIIQYDLINKKILWRTSIAYQLNNLLQFNSSIVFTTPNKSYYLDPKTGKILWSVRNNIYFISPFDNIAIGYRYRGHTKFTHELEGINLNNGKRMWNRIVDRGYGWNDLFFLNDSTLIVAAAGLHVINIKNGKGWKYYTVTGVKDYTRTIATNTAGVAVGLLTGTFFWTSGYDLVGGLVSNSLIDSAHIYLASTEQLAKIDKTTGEIAWRYIFPNELASKSIISMNDSIIYMLNTGMAYKGHRQLNFGVPFLAAFNKQTGNQIYFSSLPLNKEPIQSYRLSKTTIYIISRDKILKYSLADGSQTAETTIKKDDIGDLRYFLGGNVFVKNGNDKYVSLTQIDSTNQYLFTSSGKTLSIDNKLNVVDTFNLADLGFLYLNFDDLRFITKDKKTIITKSDGEIIANIEMTSNAFLFENFLYEWSDRSIRTIDINEIKKCL